MERIDKSAFPTVPLADFDSVVERNYYAMDGYPTDGIFDNGSDIATRFDRCRNGDLMLNGGGGEVFRNFFYLRNTSFSLTEFLWTFYSRFKSHTCTKRFSEHAYLGNLADKLKFTLGRDTRMLERAEIELLYPAFRCRYWMGRNNCVNSRFGWTLTPFVDLNIVSSALEIPLEYKTHGLIEGRMIRAVDPALAKYPSVYGHSFATDPPLKRRLADQTTLLRPCIARRYSYRIRYPKERNIAYPLQDQYISRVINTDFPYLSRFFVVSRVMDAEHFARICTLEYLFQAVRPNVGDDGAPSS